MFFQVSHLVIACLTTIGGIVGVYVALVNRVTKLETRVQHMEHSLDRFTTGIEKKLDRIERELVELKVVIAKNIKDKDHGNN